MATYLCDICGKEFDEVALLKIDKSDSDTSVYMCPDCIKMVYYKTYNAEMIKAHSGDNDAINNLKKFIQPMIQQKDTESINTDNLSALAKEMYATISINSPSVLKAHLDKYVIGQEDAKKTLSLAVYNHYKRCLFDIAKKTKQINTSSDDMPDEVQKSNILIAGPSGCGKTYVLKTLAKKLNLPFVCCNASGYTQSGYVGTDIDDCVRQLYREAGEDILRAQYGIIFLDEFDKLSRKTGDTAMITSDPGHEGVQQEILKMLEGTVVNFTQSGQRKHPDAPTTPLDTTNILFVCGGAFEGIDKIISSRAFGGSIGFDMSNNKQNGKISIVELNQMNECDKYNTIIEEATDDDFRKFGLISEVLGRLPVICPFHQLSEDELCKILTEPKNALIKQYATQYTMIDKISLNIDNDALKAVASEVIKHKTGARGLRTVLEKTLSKALYDAIDKARELRKNNSNSIVEIKMTADNITNNTKPEIIVKQKEEN